MEQQMSESQMAAYTGTIEAVSQGVKRIKIIGNAGTGKTWLSGKIVEHFLTICKGRPVYVTAPTNKAVAVITKKIPNEPINQDLVFKTQHGAVDMKMHTNERTGERRFIKPKFKKWKIDKNDYTRSFANIADEVSMLNTEFIGGKLYNPVSQQMEEVKGYLEDYNFPIIFVGDDKQLNPVGEEISPIWEKDYLTFRLTEPIRQGEGNPIIDLSMDLDMIPFRIPHTVGSKGYVYRDDRWDLIHDLAEVNGTDELKFLAWSNDNVDKVNHAVRVERYKNPKKIEKLETIVFNAPFGPHYTNKEIKVEDVSIITDYVPLPTHDTKWVGNEIIGRMDKVKVKYYRINDNVDVIHEDSEPSFRLIAAMLTNKCKNHNWSWKGHFMFLERFADIKYNHALTVHKSQGSTYHTTIIDIENIMHNKRVDERTRMLYTAITRSSDLVILNNVK